MRRLCGKARPIRITASATSADTTSVNAAKTSAQRRVRRSQAVYGPAAPASPPVSPDGAVCRSPMPVIETLFSHDRVCLRSDLAGVSSVEAPLLWNAAVSDMFLFRR